MKHPNSERSLGWLLATTGRLHRFNLNERLSEFGLYAGQEQVLKALGASGGLSVGELADILHVRAPTVSKATNRLSALGLVERREVPDDGRSVLIKLTRKGKDRLKSINTIWDEAERDLTAELDEKDRKRLRKLLGRAANNLSKALGGDERDFDIPIDTLDDHRV
jgi:DNA-binding MarR family transcriptional regulator